MKKIIDAANLIPQDIILEIGPGIGTLTQELAKRAKKVIAVEKDQKLVEIIKETLKEPGNVKIIKGDVLKIQFSKLKTQNYKVVGNLPFYLTAPLIRKFLERKKSPKEMILLVQKEVGQRVCAQPPNMNLLAVSVQFYAKPEIVSHISRKSFWPQPKVDSVIMKIAPKKLAASPEFIDIFFKIVKAGFSQPRKQLINNLLQLSLPTRNQRRIKREKIKDWLLKNNILPEQRAETLTVKDWVNLTRSSRPQS